MRGAGALFMCVASLVISRAVAVKELNNDGASTSSPRPLPGPNGPPRASKGSLLEVTLPRRAVRSGAARKRRGDANRARRGDEVDGSKLERGPIVLDKPDGDEKTIDSID